MQGLSEEQLLINACRGEVLDNQEALALFNEGRALNLVLDVWEQEPDILLALLPHLQLATAHIAGHTLEGKARGTEMLYLQLCRHLGVDADKSLAAFLPPTSPIQIGQNHSALGCANRRSPVCV